MTRRRPSDPLRRAVRPWAALARGVVAALAMLMPATATAQAGALSFADSAGFHAQAIAAGVAGLAPGGPCTGCHGYAGSGDAAPAREGDPGPESRVCLRCHARPASAASEEVGGDSPRGVWDGPPAALRRPVLPRVTVNAAADHPVGRSLPAGPGFHEATLVRARGLHLPGGRVECTTCHDPHAPGRRALLRQSNAGSGLCYLCHRL